MATEMPAWFVHALNDSIQQLYQQQDQLTAGAYRVREGVTGKTYPWNRLGTVRMEPLARDADTTYANPPQSKRRCTLLDRGVAVLIDDMDVLKMPPSPQSEFVQIMVNARNVEMDAIILAAAIGTA